MLCGLMNGSRVERSWLGGDGAYDFYDVKGAVEGLFQQLGIDVSFENSSDEGLHPTRQAAIITKNDGKKVSWASSGRCTLKWRTLLRLRGRSAFSR